LIWDAAAAIKILEHVFVYSLLFDSTSTRLVLVGYKVFYVCV